LCLILHTAPARAATLSLTASALAIEIGAFPGFEVGQSPDPISVLTSVGGFSLPPLLFSGTFTTKQTVTFSGFPVPTVLSSLTIRAANLAGSFAASAGFGGGFGGPMPLQGQAIVAVLGGLINLVIPLSVAGAAGTQVIAAGTFSLLISVTGMSWTTGAAQLTGVTTTTANEAVVHTVTRSGSDTRTPSGVGEVRLVSPIRVLTNTVGTLPGFATQVLRFVPEPGSALMLAAGAMALALIAARRGRRR
jgi:hypothetical protein